MIIRNVPHFDNWGPAFEEIRRNPNTEGQKTNPCLTNDFKNVNPQFVISNFVWHF